MSALRITGLGPDELGRISMRDLITWGEQVSSERRHR